MKPTKQPPVPSLAPRRKMAMALGRVLPAVLPATGAHGGTLGQIASNWGALCPGLAAYSYPTKLFKGTLTVAVASSSVKQEVMYLAPQIIQGAGVILGFSGIEKIMASTAGWKRTSSQTLKPQALSKEEVAKASAKCKNVADDDLREALARLGAWAARTDKK